MIKYFLMLFFLTLFSCENISRKNIDEYYVPSGTARYILPQVSTWFNYSQTAGCFREQVTKSLDYTQLKKSFGITYDRAVQLQIGFNQERLLTMQQAQVKVLPLREEERLFFATSEKVQSNVNYFKAPQFDRAHLVWVDPAQQKPALLNTLKHYLSSDIMNLGYPVFLSLCMTSGELNRFVRRKLKVGTFRAIGFEALNQYNPSSERVPGQFLYLDELFKKSTKLYFYSPTGKIPREYIGKLRKL